MARNSSYAIRSAARAGSPAASRCVISFIQGSKMPGEPRHFLHSSCAGSSGSPAGLLGASCAIAACASTVGRRDELRSAPQRGCQALRRQHNDSAARAMRRRRRRARVAARHDARVVTWMCRCQLRGVAIISTSMLRVLMTAYSMLTRARKLRAPTALLRAACEWFRVCRPASSALVVRASSVSNTHAGRSDALAVRPDSASERQAADYRAMRRGAR